MKRAHKPDPRQAADRLEEALKASDVLPDEQSLASLVDTAQWIRDLPALEAGARAKGRESMVALANSKPWAGNSAGSELNDPSLDLPDLPAAELSHASTAGAWGASKLWWGIVLAGLFGLLYWQLSRPDSDPAPESIPDSESMRSPQNAPLAGPLNPGSNSASEGSLDDPSRLDTSALVAHENSETALESERDISASQVIETAAEARSSDGQPPVETDKSDPSLAPDADTGASRNVQGSSNTSEESPEQSVPESASGPSAQDADVPVPVVQDPTLVPLRSDGDTDLDPDPKSTRESRNPGGPTGYVRDAQGHPIPEALISVWRRGEGLVYVQRSEDDGQFNLLLAPGSYRFEASADGYASAWYRGSSSVASMEDASWVELGENSELREGIDIFLSAKVVEP